MDFLIEKLIATLGLGYYILVYGIGLLGMIFSVISIQFKHRVTIILCNMLGQILWVAYFLLQGDAISGIACGLSAAILAVFSKKNEWKWATSRITVVVFILILLVFSLFTFKEWADIFPLLAGVFLVIANSQSDEKRLRQFTLPWSILWLLNSTFKMYPVAFVNDLFYTVSTVIALVRYRNKDESEEETET